MLKADLDYINKIHFTPKLTNGEVLYGCCSAVVKQNLFNYIFKSIKDNYWLGFSNCGIHHYKLDNKDNPVEYKFYDWKNIEDISFRFAGSHASFCFMFQKQKQYKYLLRIEEKLNYIKLDKKAIVFLMMKGSKHCF